MDEQSLRERNLCSTWWQVCNPQAPTFDAASIADSVRWRACPARRTHRRRQVIQLFYGIAAMNALFSSMAWCAAKPNRWSILALLTFAVVWAFVPLTGIWKATSFLRWTAPV